MERAIPATEFKAHVLKLLDRVAAGEEIIVTKHGRPIAKLVPLGSQESSKPLQGCFRVPDPGDDLELDEPWEASLGHLAPE